MCTGHSRPGSVSDYPVQSSWEHMMQSRSGQSVFPHPASGVEERTNGNGGGEKGGVQAGSGLKQRYGQLGAVSDGHVTLGGNDISQHQSSNSQHSHGFTPTHHQSHTPSPDSPPSSPLTSIPRKKHSDNSKPINIAVYSAPLSPHSDEKNPRCKRPSPPGMNMQMFPLQSHSRKTYPSHVNIGDHVPLTPREPPNGSGYEQSATPPVMLAPPPSSKPHPQELAYGQLQQPLIRSGSNSVVGTSLGSRGHQLSRRSSAGLYGIQTATSGAVVPHQYNQSSSSNPGPASYTMNHSVSFGSDQVHPHKQLSTKSLQGHPSLPHPSQSTDEDNPMMSSSQHPHHGQSYMYHTPHSSSSISYSPHSSQHHQPHPSSSSSFTFHPSNSQQDTHQPDSVSSLPLPPPQVSRAEGIASNVEAQPTPEMMLQRQPVALNHSLSGNHFKMGGLTSGTGMSTVSHSYFSSQHRYWSASQSSLTVSHSSCNSRRTSDTKVPQIQVDPIPATLVTSSTRTKPTAAINEGGSSSSSPVHRRRMGHCRHLSLGNNIPRQRPTHSRNRSLGSVNFNHMLPPNTLSSRQESLGNLSLLSRASSKTGSRLSLNSGFLSEAQVPQTPDPENGYDFVQHFNLFSQYTSNMALEYYTARRESSTHPPTTPPVWCMDVWNRLIVVGCGNGQIEVGVASLSCVHTEAIVIKSVCV